ncbi:hypothetical protein Amir_0919 [Actinosynnema mirum DSM 43827]|uniref:Uncharacterized protein n=1 Tax=Actinosynnema mirum (strain ATCC 29888 / DSM 43827 / JCM 3225 / NBRC 14064 / NCIMB 13271 / NRRL B-12336 / IMRU 3971 / 101) TaxID=446462 RepID=C6WME5_ACTMD|nr:hypothetical protein Amir_0919 [Actinosynnema mirum DSM 43827]
MLRPSREAVARWNTAYAEQTNAMFAAAAAGDLAAVQRLAVSYAAVARAWRALGGELAVSLWARHACVIAAEEFERRAEVEHARASRMELDEDAP